MYTPTYVVLILRKICSCMNLNLNSHVTFIISFRILGSKAHFLSKQLISFIKRISYIIWWLMICQRTKYKTYYVCELILAITWWVTIVKGWSVMIKTFKGSYIKIPLTQSAISPNMWVDMYAILHIHKWWQSTVLIPNQYCI